MKPTRMITAVTMVAAMFPPARVHSQPQSEPTISVQKIGHGVTPPRLKYQPEPEYSEKARAGGYEGVCTLSLIVGVDGKTSNIRVVNAIGLGLDEKAVEAVRNWRFDPARKDGVPVAVQLAVEVDFHLYGNPTTAKMAELRKKVAAGDARAEFELANDYFEGRKLPRDEKEGMVLLEKASNQGLSQAQFMLAERLIHAGSTDYPKAYMWYALAQRGGEKHSNKALKKLTAQMTPDQLQAGRGASRQLAYLHTINLRDREECLTRSGGQD